MQSTYVAIQIWTAPRNKITKIINEAGNEFRGRAVRRQIWHTYNSVRMMYLFMQESKFHGFRSYRLRAREFNDLRRLKPIT